MLLGQHAAAAVGARLSSRQLFSGEEQDEAFVFCHARLQLAVVQAGVASLVQQAAPAAQARRCDAFNVCGAKCCQGSRLG